MVINMEEKIGGRGGEGEQGGNEHTDWLVLRGWHSDKNLEKGKESVTMKDAAMKAKVL